MNEVNKQFKDIQGRFRAFSRCPTCGKYIVDPENAPLPHCSEECRDGKPKKPDSENFLAGKCVICGRDITDAQWLRDGLVCSAACWKDLREWDGYLDNIYPEIYRCLTCGIRYAIQNKPKMKGCCNWPCRKIHNMRTWKNG